ncbi:MAG: thioesterase family protein [Bacteroidia bacterium]|nr:thioesterase family protein [Bacteroidia bacterium]
MIQSETKLRVRYSETDQMGYVYYGNYPQYYEIARVDLMRSAGISYKSIEDNGILMPVISMNIRYIKPSLYDELITIRTKVDEKPSASIRFVYEIFNEQNELVNKAETTLVFIDSVTRKLKKPPENITELFEKYF